MGRKKKKRRFGDSALEPGAAEAPEVTVGGDPARNDPSAAPTERTTLPASSPPTSESAVRQAFGIPAARPLDPRPTPAPWQEAEPPAALGDSVSPPAEVQAEAPPRFFARLAGWWRRLTRPAEGLDFHLEPGASPPPLVEQAAAELTALEVAEAPQEPAAAPPEPLTAPPDFAGPVDADPTGTLESSLRLAAGLETLRERLQNREKHLESLREQRNGLHHQLSGEREAADSRIRTLEEELAELRSHAEEPAPQLQEALDASTARIQALEAELTESRDNATTAQAALAAQESRLRALEEEIARMRMPVEEALEQYRLEKEATLHRVRSLETELGAAREQAGAADARAGALESDLNEMRARAETAEGRAAALETELEHSRAELARGLAELDSARAAASAASEAPAELVGELEEERSPARELGEKVEELARRLAVAEREQEAAGARAQRDLEQAQQESRRALSQVLELQSALQHAEERAQQREAELTSQKRMVESLEAEQEEPRRGRKREPVPPQAGRAEPAAEAEVSAQVAADLYKKALTPLTVLVASADLLVMGLKDPSLKESAQDIKFQSQALMELLQKTAQPPEKK